MNMAAFDDPGWLTLEDYCKSARTRLNLTSDRQLAMRLGLNPGAVYLFRAGKSLPSPGTMILLARLAGRPDACGLADLQIWREKSPEARKGFETIREVVESARKAGAIISIAAIALLATPAGTKAAQNDVITPPRDIMENYWRRWIAFWTSFFHRKNMVLA